MKRIDLPGVIATLMLMNAASAVGNHSIGLKRSGAWIYPLTAAAADPQPADGSFLLTLLPMIVVAIFAVLGVSLFFLTIRSILKGIASRRSSDPSSPEASNEYQGPDQESPQKKRGGENSENGNTPETEKSKPVIRHDQEIRNDQGIRHDQEIGNNPEIEK